MTQFVRPGTQVSPTPDVVVDTTMNTDVISIITPTGTTGYETAVTPPQVIAYHHNQGVPTSVWDVNHALGFYPNVTVEDSAGNIVEGEIEYLGLNDIRLTFSSAFSGHAYLS